MYGLTLDLKAPGLVNASMSVLLVVRHRFATAERLIRAFRRGQFVDVNYQDNYGTTVRLNPT